MPDEPVDWRELTRMPMTVEVAQCAWCPCVNRIPSGVSSCRHPNAPTGLVVTAEPPAQCPLRVGPLTIQLARASTR